MCAGARGTAGRGPRPSRDPASSGGRPGCSRSCRRRRATLIGEFGIGTNPHIDVVCDDILIDEKINGTVHIALGRAYPECGGRNESAIRWDIVKDVRGGDEVLIDGERVVDGTGLVR